MYKENKHSVTCILLQTWHRWDKFYDATFAHYLPELHMSFNARNNDDMAVQANETVMQGVLI